MDNSSTPDDFGIKKWWERIGCSRNPGTHTGEEQARDLEIADLRAELASRGRAQGGNTSGNDCRMCGGTGVVGSPLDRYEDCPECAHPAVQATPAIPAGWKPAPVEPTSDMLLAAYYPDVNAPKRREIYQAMLAAAPQLDAAVAAPALFNGVIDAGDYDPETGMIRITVKLPIAGLPQELRTIGAKASIVAAHAAPAGKVQAEPTVAGWTITKIDAVFHANALRVMAPNGSAVTLRRDAPDPTETVLYRYFAGIIEGEESSGAAARDQALPDEVREQVRDAVARALTGVYYCSRVWSAWSYGTMSEDDFAPAAEDDNVLDNIVDSAIRAMKGRAASKEPEGREQCMHTYCLLGEKCQSCGHVVESQGWKGGKAASKGEKGGEA